MNQLNKAVNSAKEKVWDQGFNAGYGDALDSVFNLDEAEASKHGFGYAACQYCGKPLYGVLVDAKDNLGKWVLDKVREAGWHHTKCAGK